MVPPVLEHVFAQAAFFLETHPQVQTDTAFIESPGGGITYVK
jgi:hypothetical protein